MSNIQIFKHNFRKMGGKGKRGGGRVTLVSAWDSDRAAACLIPNKISFVNYLKT